MFTKKELTWMIIFILIMGFILGFSEKPDFTYYFFLISAIIIVSHILVKKLFAIYFAVRIEHKPFYWQRWGWYERSHLRWPIPMGLILPFFLSLFSLGIVKMLWFFEFNLTPTKKKSLRVRGMHRREEVNETDFALIAFWGFIWLLVLAIIASFLHHPDLAKYAVFYGLWNLIPIAWLDGSRLFYGTPFTWFFMMILYLISLVAVML